MSLDTHHYTNDEVTVVWKPKMCIHSRICWNGLLQVFDPRVRPWVKMDGAPTEKIIEQVRKCPSGALSYFLNNTASDDTNKVVAENANMTTIQVTPDGPYIIQTECKIAYSNGKEEIKTGTIALCRCGASGTKPYCDGSHESVRFKG